MLSRMGLVMLAGKGLLGTRTGRALVGRLGRGIVRTALDKLGRSAGGADVFLPDGGGRRGGQAGRMAGRCAAGGRREQTDGLWETAQELLTPSDAAAACGMPADRKATDAVADRPVDDACRKAALTALAAHTVSFIDGRVRLRHPALRRPETHAPLREALARESIFSALTFSARTGSLLLEYDGRRLSHADFCEAALPLGWFLAQWERHSQVE
ncbi:hypothetical protein [uncultured Desulfovibrio sp.]|uniref:hypothetical protein n=1 Tax=uncultured Desulfovibrio sp. TaxID=167968 RepID=UPI0026181143|nr:hypothetical protein [uncultured Desulfovibrio sp.]